MSNAIDKKNISLDKEDYIQSIFKNLKISDCISCSTPMEECTNETLTSTEGWTYLYQATRPDISFAVIFLSRLNNCY